MDDECEIEFSCDSCGDTWTSIFCIDEDGIETPKYANYSVCPHCGQQGSES